MKRDYASCSYRFALRSIIMNVKKGDNVQVISGKNRGKSGKIMSVFTKKGRVVIEGINLYKKHVRAKRQGEKGQVVEVPRSIDASNVMLVCKGCGKPTRTGFRAEEGVKKRVCKKCKVVT